MAEAKTLGAFRGFRCCAQVGRNAMLLLSTLLSYADWYQPFLSDCMLTATSRTPHLFS
jgi:hypothetical protein